MSEDELEILYHDLKYSLISGFVFAAVLIVICGIGEASSKN